MERRFPSLECGFMFAYTVFAGPLNDIRVSDWLDRRRCHGLAAFVTPYPEHRQLLEHLVDLASFENVSLQHLDKKNEQDPVIVLSICLMIYSTKGAAVVEALAFLGQLASNIEAWT